MPNFILAGEQRDGVMEANRAHQSGQQQWPEPHALADQSESGERDLSLTLVQREYSYNCLKSWWQNVERRINQSASDNRRIRDCLNGTANNESTLKGGSSELQENHCLEGVMDVVRDAEECVHVTEPELEETPRSSRTSMQATPEALFLAEKLQQLADTTREMAQHLLSPEAVQSRRVATPGCEVLDATLDTENSAGSRKLGLMRQKILLLDEVVAELSQYRLSPRALDMTEWSMGEPSHTEYLRNESAITCNSAVVDSAIGDSKDFKQELDKSFSAGSLAEDTQNTAPNATENLSMWSESFRIADKELLNVGVTTEEDSEHTEVSSYTLANNPPPQYFAAEVKTDEIRQSPVQIPQREPETDFPSSHLEACTSDLLLQDFGFSTCNGKEVGGTAQRIRPELSRVDPLDRVTATAHRLLRFPIMKQALSAKQTNTAEEVTAVAQMIPRLLVQSDEMPSVSGSPQQEPQMHSCSSYLDTSTSDLLSQGRGFRTSHGNERPYGLGGTLYQGHQRTSQLGRIDGMIALVQRLLGLRIMGHAPTFQNPNTTGDGVKDHVIPWHHVRNEVATGIAPSHKNISRLVQTFGI